MTNEQTIVRVYAGLCNFCHSEARARRAAESPSAGLQAGRALAGLLAELGLAGLGAFLWVTRRRAASSREPAGKARRRGDNCAAQPQRLPRWSEWAHSGAPRSQLAQLAPERLGCL